MSVEVKISGDAFRRKVRQALDLWVKLRPHEARAFVRNCRRMREQSVKKDRDLWSALSMPSWPVEVLRQSEWSTQFQYGVPCGTGDRLWDSKQDLQDIFLSEMPEAALSDRRGAPAKRGWS